MLKAMSSFPPHVQKRIIIACMALHNFIHDSKLRDKEFEKCDEDENYVPKAARASIPTQVEDIQDVDNEDTMNKVRDKIADSLVRVRGR